jgi:hypothetical protein
VYIIFAYYCMLELNKPWKITESVLNHPRIWWYTDIPLVDHLFYCSFETFQKCKYKSNRNPLNVYICTFDIHINAKWRKPAWSHDKSSRLLFAEKPWSHEQHLSTLISDYRVNIRNDCCFDGSVWCRKVSTRSKNWFK